MYINENNIKYLHPMICIFVIMLSGWCRTRKRSFATDVICFFVHYLSREIIKLCLIRNKIEILKLLIYSRSL